MDISKYIVTAIMLTSIFGDIDERWIVYAICGSTVLVTLLWGLYLTKEPKIRNKRRK
jgi:hypothetical protein